jgi:hypothetical protein
MERLPFHLPEFVRTAWVSEDARAYWEPKIQAINHVWPLVERASVYERLRRGALQSVEPPQLPELQVECFAHNTPMTIVGVEGAHERYGNAAIPYQPGQPFVFRVYIGAWPKTFLAAWEAGDQREIGRTLGFPECCVQFFERYWQQDGWRDLTYPMLESQHENRVTNNVLLKALGVRPVFHLPCSFTCQASCEIGEQILALMVLLGHTQEEAWLRELLSMPMEWTSLHGVAIVVTPLFKVVYASDPLPMKATLQLRSDHYPVYGGRGNTFPFSRVQPLPVVNINRDLGLQRFNGFATREAMQRAHQFVVDALPPEVYGSVLDLGCGDGALLRAVHARHPYTELHGVEQRTDLLHGYDTGDLFTWEWHRDYRIVLLAAQRLTEVDRATAFGLLDRIAAHAETLVLYSYAAWPHELGDLVETCFSVVTGRRDAVLNCEVRLCESRVHASRRLARSRIEADDAANASPAAGATARGDSRNARGSGAGGRGAATTE